jgi:hypothetical protein
MKNIRDLCSGINEFKKVYQPITNMVTEENGDLLADSHIILNRWKNYFCQLLNVHGVNDVRQTEIHTAEPLDYDSRLLTFQTWSLQADEPVTELLRSLFEAI